MKAPFKFDLASAIDKACAYSDAPETLRSLISRLEIEVGPHTVIPSPCHTGPRPLKALHMLVTVEGFTFPYYGSHNDAEAMGSDVTLLGWTQLEKRRKEALVKARKDFREGLLYSLLCAIRCDYSIAETDLEEFGFNRDSIKDIAKWNEFLEHSRKLRAALRLSREELESLPS